MEIVLVLATAALVGLYLRDQWPILKSHWSKEAELETTTLVSATPELPTDWKQFHADNVAKLDPALRTQAVDFLRGHLADSAETIRAEMALDLQDWWVKHHHGAMTGVRNALRMHGFGEKEFGIDNLDDYAVGLVELAFPLEKS